MKRITPLMFAWFAFAVGMAHAVPARPLYEPPAPPDLHDYRGTQWFGTTYEGNTWLIVFHPDGKVTNRDGANVYKHSGNWKSSGNSIYMELNGKYYEYRGLVIGEDLQGDSSNVTGLKWKTNFRRLAPGDPRRLP